MKHKFYEKAALEMATVQYGNEINNDKLKML